MLAAKTTLIKNFNKYIRLRDAKDGYFVCISCNQFKKLEHMHAGHFFSAGHNEAVRFDEMNVNGQCDRCNFFLHGNERGYRLGMIKKYGEQAILKLEIKRQTTVKWGEFEYRILNKEILKKIKELENVQGTRKI